MTWSKKSAFLGFALFIAAMTQSEVSAAFRNVKIGDAMPNAEMVSLEGPSASLLSAKAKVNIVLMFQPNQIHSNDALKVLSKVCNEFPNRSVHGVAVVSDFYSKELIRASVVQSGWKAANTLIDKEDLYSAKVGVVSYPIIGITNSAFTLLAQEPFLEINYFERIEARVKYALGELTKDQLNAALNPPIEDGAAKTNHARLYFKYAKKLFDAGKLDKAMERARQALGIDEKFADAYALIGLIYAKQSNCAEAERQFEKALALMPDNKLAKQGMALCQ